MNAQEILEAIKRLSLEEQRLLLRKTLLIILKSERNQEVHGVAQESAEEYQAHRSEGVYTEQEIEFFIERLVAILRRPDERQKLLNILAVFYSDDSMIVRLAGHEKDTYNFFDSAGILEHWTVDGAQLRKDAWRRRD